MKGRPLSLTEFSARDEPLEGWKARSHAYMFIAQMDPLGGHHHHSTVGFQERVGMEGFEPDVGSTMWHGAADLGLISRRPGCDMPKCLSERRLSTTIAEGVPAGPANLGEFP